MYKLTATLPRGLTWVTNSEKASDLCRIADSLGSVQYSIARNGEYVLEFTNGITVEYWGVYEITYY